MQTLFFTDLSSSQIRMQIPFWSVLRLFWCFRLCMLLSERKLHFTILEIIGSFLKKHFSRRAARVRRTGAKAISIKHIVDPACFSHHFSYLFAATSPLLFYVHPDLAKSLFLGRMFWYHTSEVTFYVLSYLSTQLTCGNTLLRFFNSHKDDYKLVSDQFPACFDIFDCICWYLRESYIFRFWR